MIGYHGLLFFVKYLLLIPSSSPNGETPPNGKGFVGIDTPGISIFAILKITVPLKLFGNCALSIYPRSKERGYFSS